jgi:hypothetical protein
MKGMFGFTGCLVWAASATFAGPGVDVEATTDTVMKVKYTGGSPAGSAPAVTVEGKKNGLSAKSSGASGYAVLGTGGDVYSTGVMGVVTEDYSNAVVGDADGNGSNGVVGYAGTSGSGVYGDGDPGAGSYAGVFNGNVYISGVCNPCSLSDGKFKKNVHSLQGGLQKVLALEPKTYEMEVDKYKGKINLSRGTHIGLMAEDVSKVVPEAVHALRSVNPRKSSGGGDEGIDFQAINYGALIPVLIGAIKEQQAQIEELKRQIKSR